MNEIVYALFYTRNWNQKGIIVLFLFLMKRIKHLPSGMLGYNWVFWLLWDGMYLLP